MNCKKLTISMLKRFQYFFKQDTYVLFDNLYEKNAECIDTYSLFTHMRDKGMKAYYCIWRENPFYKELKRRNDLKNIVVLKKNAHESDEFLYVNFWKLARAKYVITSFGDLGEKITAFLHKSKRTTYLHTGHGMTFLKTFALVMGLFDHKKYDRMLVSNQLEQDLFVRFGWKRENLPMTGLPRWDLLKKTPHQGKNIFVMFTWRTSFLPFWRKKYPKDIADSEYFKGVYAFINNPKLQKMLADNNVKMKLALHHSMIDQAASKLPDFGNIEIVLPTAISRYIGTTDLFITDYSSIVFDFLFLDIPTIFYRPDFDDKELCEWDLGDFENARKEDEHLFNVCYDADKAIALVSHYIKNGFATEEKNKKKTEKLFAVRKNIRNSLLDYMENTK